jgi:hypothetical protein
MTRRSCACCVLTRTLQVLLFSLGTACLVAFAFGVDGIFRGLQSDAWGLFWASLLAGIPLLAVAIPLVIVARSYARRSDVAIWLVRQSATAGDDSLVPPVDPQPEPLSPEPL